MSKVRVEGFSISLDGFGAGPQQSLEHPLGVGGTGLHQWLLPTHTFQSLSGKAGGTTGVDEEFASRGFRNVGAWIMGRNMFGPIRGEWRGSDWKGWWGASPPYHTPVFVLTHYPRESIVMEGGTTFHFVTEGITTALQRAKDAASGTDIRIGGGVATVKAFLRAGLIDALHLAVAPVVLGSGENLFAGIDLAALGYRCARHRSSELAWHLVIDRIDQNTARATS